MMRQLLKFIKNIANKYSKPSLLQPLPAYWLLIPIQQRKLPGKDR